MLQFLRKHQKVLFIVVTVAIVISFCFFGTYGAMSGADTQEDRTVTQGVTGQAITERALNAVCRLISSSVFDTDKRSLPNFLNDGVIEKDFLANGLSVLLAKQYFGQLKPELDERVKKVSGFRPYVHPHAAQISVEGIWSRFSPAFLERYKMLKSKSDQSTAETFALLSQVYLEQAMLSPDTMRQVLAMQQQQFGVDPDPKLYDTDFSLFGFKSIEDWFGPKFVSLVGQFILNAAHMASDRGYSVKRDEVRANLFHNIYQGYAQISRKKNLTPEEAHNYYQGTMRALGMDEDTLLNAWSQVMLCRRLFDDAGASVIIDPLSFHQFASFTQESVLADLYELPSALQFSDFRSMLKFQVYLESVTAPTPRAGADLLLSPQFASVDQVEKKTPELVERDYTLEWSTVNVNDLASEISLKETWEWQGKDPHWELLKKNFSELNGVVAHSKQERLAALDKIDKKVRGKIDQYARKKMVESHPDQIQLALQKAHAISKEVGLRSKGGALPFKGVKDQSYLISLLEKTPLESETPNRLREQLHFFTGDNENYYRIQVLRRAPEKRVLLFAQAARDGTLDQLLDKRLEAAYPEVRRKEPQLFQQTGGQFRPFHEVKDRVGKLLFSDLLSTIEQNYLSQYGMLPGTAGDLPLQFYSNARALSLVKEAKRHLEQNPNDDKWLKVDPTAEDTLETQCKLIKSVKTMERSTPLPFSKKEMFTLDIGQWSSIHVGERGSVVFYRIATHEHPKRASLETLDQAHQVLSMDAKRDLMQRILQKIAQSGAVDLTEKAGEARL